MKQNMGSADRLIRLAVTVVLGGLYFSGAVTGILGIIVLVLGIIMLITSMAGYCPLYAPFGISTCRKVAS